MAWIDNNGGFKAHRKHWVNKSTVGGKGRTDKGGGGRKEGKDGGWKKGRGGGSSSQTVQSVDYLFSRSLLAASRII